MNNRLVITIENGEYLQNCYIVKNISDNKCIIIDPGYDFNKIDNVIVRNSLVPKYILYTHGHHDHIASTNKFINKYPDIKLYGPSKINDIVTNHKIHLGSKEISVFHKINKLQNKNNILDYAVEYIPTPGHTACSSFLYFKNILSIFSGDTLFLNDIGAVRFPTHSKSDMKSTLKYINSIKEDAIVYPGHGPTTTIKFEQKNNYYLINEVI